MLSFFLQWAVVTVAKLAGCMTLATIGLRQNGHRMVGITFVLGQTGWVSASATAAMLYPCVWFKIKKIAKHVVMRRIRWSQFATTSKNLVISCLTEYQRKLFFLSKLFWDR